MAKKRVLNKSKIIDSTLITPNLRRITVDISKLNHIDGKDRGGYIKLSVLDENSQEVMRSISVSSVDSLKQSLTLDFVNHGGFGPAAKFARSAKSGDEIVFYGPGPRRDIDQELEEFILIGDMTAFPALKVQLELMVENKLGAKAHIILEAKNSEDFSYFSDLISNENFNFNFIEGSFTAKGLLTKLKETESKIDSSKKLSLWCAGERLAINEVRQYLKDRPELDFEDKYTSSYWQCGLTQNEHSKAKKVDLI